MFNHQLVYQVVIWAFLGIILWRAKVALTEITDDNYKTSVLAK